MGPYEERGCVDSEEDEVRLRFYVVDGYGEELADGYGANGAGAGGDIDAFCADVGWEDLLKKKISAMFGICREETGVLEGRLDGG